MKWRAQAAVGAAIAVTAVVATAAVAGVWPYAVLGTGDPGSLVRMVAPLLRLTVDVSATVCVGSLVYAVFLAGPAGDGLVAPAAYQALRQSGRAASVWALTALVLWPFDAAVISGLSMRQILTQGGLSAVTDAVEGPKGWLVTVVAAAVVAVGCRLALRWNTALWLCGLAVFGLLPPLVGGHSSSDAGHDLATAVIMLHVPVAVVWLGTLLAVLRFRAQAADRAAVMARYRRLSVWCWWLTAYSGLADAVVLAPPGGWRSGYGLLLALKILMIGVVGVGLWRLRKKSSARWLPVEAAAVVAAFGLSVALTILPAPKFLLRASDIYETLLGYGLSSPPTLARLVFDVRPELLFLPACVVLCWAYAMGVRRVGRTWPAVRTAAWVAGWAVVAFATSAGLGRYAPAMFSVQAAAHMLIGMVAPLLLVLGAPLTLLRAAGRPDGLPGWAALADSRLVHGLTRPLVATGTFALSPFVLYFTDLYDLTVRFHWAHLAMDAYFLAAGYLFMWVVVGPDPVARPVAALGRLGLVLAMMPVDLAFGVAIVTSRRIIGNGDAGANLYTALDLSWVDLAADQRLGGYLALAIGEAAVVALLAVLVSRWRPSSLVDDDAALVALAAQQGGSPAELGVPPIGVEAPGAEGPRPPAGRSPVGVEGPKPQAVGDDQQR